MRKDFTDLTLVIDRSGSMRSCMTDAQGGINQLIEDQKKLPGHATLSLVQFDTEYEFVHRAVPIRDVPEYKLVPRGSTALLDAVGKAIVETGERLSRMQEQDRPGVVAFVIVTDGQENASHEYKKDQIKDMIKQQQDVYKWHFTFLGANQDAFAEAGSMGIGAANAMQYTSAKSAQAYQVMSGKLGAMRSASANDQDVAAAAAFTDAERAEAIK